MSTDQTRPGGRITRRTAVAGGSALAAAILAGGRAAVAGAGSTPEATPGATSAGTPSTDGAGILIRLEYIGGFVPPVNNLLNLPIYQLTDDGREFTQGPQILIYPPPSLPNLQVARLSDVGVQAVLDAADAAGLTTEDAQYSNDLITDLPTLVISIVTGDRVVTTSTYGLDQIDPATQPDLVEPRDRIQGFLGVIQNPASLRDPSLVAETETAWTEDRLQTVAVTAEQVIIPEDGTIEGVEPSEPIEWPLDTPLSDLGVPLAEAVGGENYEGIFPGARVATLTGDDLAAVRPLAETANQNTVWLDGDQEWVLLLRPVLPGELADLARPNFPGAPQG